MNKNLAVYHNDRSVQVPYCRLTIKQKKWRQKKSEIPHESPSVKRGKVTRNNPQGIEIKVTKNRGRGSGKTQPKKLEFSENELDLDDGIQIEIGEGKGFSDEDTVSSNNNAHPTDETDKNFTEDELEWEQSRSDQEQNTTKKGVRSSKQDEPQPGSSTGSVSVYVQQLKKLLFENDDLFDDVVPERRIRGKHADTNDLSMSPDTLSKGKTQLDIDKVCNLHQRIMTPV